MAVTQGKDGLYGPTQVTLTTVSDIIALKGTAAQLVGGARIVINPSDPELQGSGALSAPQVVNIFLKDKGGDVKASYATHGDVLWPQDFSSWNMVSLYFNFEQATLYWLNEVGATAQDVASAKVYYDVSYTVPGASTAQVDDLVYVPAVQGFAVLPLKALQATPLAMNSGAVANEMAHRLFHEKVYGGDPLSSALSGWASSLAPSPANVLQSVDDGLADFHAYGASCSTVYGCNARFLAGSVADSIVQARDFSAPSACMTAGLQNVLKSYGFNAFVSGGYDLQLGTLLAAALYRTELATGDRRTLEKAVFAAYSDASAASPGLAQRIALNLNQPNLFTLGAVANGFVQHLADSRTQLELCRQLGDRLQLPMTDLPACPPGATPPGNCPSLLGTP